jgi:acetylornithine deacetylase/succinyl-diaminopimelate desuccinylase-like protein
MLTTEVNFKSLVQSYLDANRERMLTELLELLRIPSVSADSKYKDHVLKAAEFISSKLAAAGADNVEICPTPGHPIVYGEKIINPDLPTVLVIPLTCGIPRPSSP